MSIKFTIFFMFIVHLARGCETGSKKNTIDQEISKPCYPIADLPNSHGSLVLQKLLGETDFECSIFTHSMTYSLVMIRKHNEQLICEERSLNSLDFIRNNEIKKELIASAKVNVLQRAIDVKSADVLIKTLKNQVVKAAYSTENKNKFLMLDGYICDVYVKGKKNELPMYAARFENPATSSHSCGIISDAIGLYVKTENVTYRSLDLSEIVKYLIDQEDGKKNIEDPVLKNKNSITPNSKKPGKATDSSDGLLSPPSFEKLKNEK